VLAIRVHSGAVCAGQMQFARSRLLFETERTVSLSVTHASVRAVDKGSNPIRRGRLVQHAERFARRGSLQPDEVEASSAVDDGQEREEEEEDERYGSVKHTARILIIFNESNSSESNVNELKFLRLRWI
jgi:hypothetical protein